MKSFQLVAQSKRQKIVVNNESEVADVDLVTSIFNGDISSTKSASVIEPLVIPLVSPNLKFIENKQQHLNSLDTQAAQELMSEIYGTVLDSSDSLVIKANNVDISRKRPLLKATTDLVLLNDDDRFHCDLENSADDVNFGSEMYNAVPVSQFGAALLRGMGWQEEKKQQLIHKEEKLVARENRLGLGATAKPPELSSSKRQHRSGENKAKSKDVWSREVESRLNQRLRDGDLVWLRDKRYVGRRGMVLQSSGVPGLDMIRVQLEGNGQVIETGRRDAVLLTESELQTEPYVRSSINSDATDISSLNGISNRCSSGSGCSNIQSSKQETKYFGKSSATDTIGLGGSVATGLCTTNSDGKGVNQSKTGDRRDIGSNCHNGDKSKSFREQPTVSGVPSGWLRVGIRVKCVSASSSAYKQKGTVLDVVSKGMACVRLDRGDVLSEVKERHLETLLPQIGGQCLVVLGPHTGETAVLIEKHSDDNTVVIELTDDLQIVLLPMDSVAAYS